MALEHTKSDGDGEKKEFLSVHSKGVQNLLPHDKNVTKMYNYILCKICNERIKIEPNKYLQCSNCRPKFIMFAIMHLLSFVWRFMNYFHMVMLSAYTYLPTIEGEHLSIPATFVLLVASITVEGIVSHTLSYSKYRNSPGPDFIHQLFHHRDVEKFVEQRSFRSKLSILQLIYMVYVLLATSLSANLHGSFVNRIMQYLGETVVVFFFYECKVLLFVDLVSIYQLLKKSNNNK